MTEQADLVVIGAGTIGGWASVFARAEGLARIHREDEKAGRQRVAMQQANGLDVRWLGATEAANVAVTLAPDGHRGGSYIESDGTIDPARNVRAYSLAMQSAGVELRERTAFTGLRTVRAGDGGLAVVGVETERGVIHTGRVIWPRSIRRGRPQPTCDGSGRPAVPGQRGRPAFSNSQTRRSTATCPRQAIQGPAPAG